MADPDCGRCGWIANPDVLTNEPAHRDRPSTLPLRATKCGLLRAFHKGRWCPPYSAGCRTESPLRKSVVHRERIWFVIGLIDRRRTARLASAQSILRPLHQLQQLGDVGCNALGDVFLNIGTLSLRRPFASAALQRSNDQDSSAALHRSRS
jgi:hypothetical protein